MQYNSFQIEGEGEMRKVLTLVIAALLGLSTFPLVLGYQSPPATYTWDESVPNYNPSAIIHTGTIDISGLVFGDFLGVSPTQPNAPGYGDSGVSVGWDDSWVYSVGDPNTNGDHLDGLWVHIIYPAEGWWDLGFATDTVVVFLSQDHGPYLGEGLECRVYGSNTLWGAVGGQAVLTDVYLDGWRPHNVAEDANGNGWCSDDIVGVYKLSEKCRYIKITAWSSEPYYNEPEVDAVAGVKVPMVSLRVSPSIVEFWTPAYGKTFSVNVTLENVTNLYGYEFKLLWNTTLLDCVGVKVTPPAEWGANYFIAKNESDEALGRYWLAVSLLPPAQPFNGSAVLCTLTFRIAYDAIYPENVTSPLDLTDTYLSDPNAEPIDHIAVDGEYWLYSTMPEIRVEPSSYTSKKVETFSVNITVHNVVNLYSYEFKLGYDTALLDALSLNVGDFLKQPYYIYKFSIDDDAGVITLGVSSKAPAPPVNGSGLLATITFKTVAIVWPDSARNTSLHLYDTVLKTNLGITVPHGTLDGFYQYTPIPGDVNSDGVVNIFDLVIVARAFGTKPGEANWDPKADLKRDGLINIFDVVLVAKNYGRTDP
jgi:hypothetical protein